MVLNQQTFISPFDSTKVIRRPSLRPTLAGSIKKKSVKSSLNLFNESVKRK